MLEVALMVGITASNMLFLFVRSLKRTTLHAKTMTFFESKQAFKFMHTYTDNYLSSDFVVDHIIVFGIIQIYFAPAIIGSVYLFGLSWKTQAKSYLVG